MYIFCRKPRKKKKVKCVRASIKQVYQVRVGKKTKTFRTKRAAKKFLK